MLVLKANEEQYNSLNNYENNGNILEFIKDKNNNWVVGINVLTAECFYKIWHELSQLETIDYIPNEENN
jgi:hypothetical protein